MLYLFLQQHPIGKVAPSAGAIFGKYNAVIPDLVFVSHERWDQIVANDRFEAAPNLVIEILSPGRENQRRDLELKKLLYGKYGVEEYWIVVPEDRSVKVFRLNDGVLQEVGSVKDAEEIQSAVLVDLHLEVAQRFDI